MTATEARLALRLPLNLGEPAHGYLLRLSSRYGCSPDRLASRLRLSGLTRGENVQRLADLAEVDAALLIANSPVVRARARTVDLAGEILLLSDWTMSSRRWCPACLAEDAGRGEHAAYHRTWWDLMSISVCPIHRIAMHDRCGRCARPTAWASGWIDRCTCGALFASQEAAVDHATGWSRYMASRLGAPVIRNGAPAADRIPLRILPRLLARFGSALRGQWRSTPPQCSDADLEICRSEALLHIDDPRVPFMAALDRMIAGRESRPAGLIGAYGWIYSHWLSFAGTDPAGIFGGLLREHAISRNVIATEEPILNGPMADTLSLTGLANRLGLSFEHAKKILLKEGALDGATRQGVAASISIDVAEDLQSRRSCLLLRKDVEQILGVGRRVVTDLADTAIIARDGNGLFDRDEVESLAVRLVRGNAWTGRRIQLMALSRSGAGTVAQLCAEIVRGRVRAAALVRNPTKLSDVAVSPDDVAGLRSGPELTVRGIARRLRLREDVTRHLAGTGILSDRADGKPTIGGITLFERSFVTTIELARRCGLSARAVWMRLEGLAVAPVFGPPTCRQIIYRRDQAEEALATLVSRVTISTRRRNDQLN